MKNEGIRVLVAVMVVMAVISFASPVVAQSQDTTTDENTFSVTCSENTVSVPLSDVKKAYNNNTGQVPGVLEPALTSNTTLVEITGADNPYYTLQTVDGSLEASSLTATETEDPDVIVRVEKSVVCALPQSNDPVQTLTEAHQDGALEITAQSTVNKVKVFIVEKVMDLASYL